MRSRSVLALGLMVGLGCSSGGDDAGPTTTIAPASTVYQPAGAAQTPFCEGMSNISTRVTSDPPDDLTAYLIVEYEALLPLVPAAIASEFTSVLDNLRSSPSASPSGTSTTPPTTFVTGTTINPDAFPDEGYLPDEEPELRLNSYLAANCFGTQSNPGPPATAPLNELPDTTVATTG